MRGAKDAGAISVANLNAHLPRSGPEKNALSRASTGRGCDRSLAYDAEIIDRQSKARGRVPLIDRNFRAQNGAKTEYAEEVARMKRIGMPDPDDKLFDFRTKAERVNARLKEEFGARFVR